MPQPRALVALSSFALAGLLALSGCSSKPAANLPDGATLVSQSATAMRAVTTAHIKIESSGKIGSIPFSAAEGDVTKTGDAKGKITVALAGSAVGVQFVVKDSNFYLNITGNWQKASAADVATYYDPRGILDPDKGVAKVLATATGASTEDTENVNGVDTYRISVKLDNTAIASVVPSVPVGTTAKIWVDQKSNQLVKAELDIPASGGGPGTVTITLSDLDKPVTVNAPI
jgi:lipoprotein LprG